MKPRRILRGFYTQNSLTVSKKLLGKYLFRKYRNKTYLGKIVETEAYIGPEDKASHAYGGKITARNKTEYLKGGYVYIYLCYGIHWQLNITTDDEKPECVLIRALEPIEEKARASRIASGPGKLTKWLKLNKSFDGEDLTASERIWLEDRGEEIKESKIISAKRIGIDYAEEWAQRPWRFYIKGNKFVSKTIKV